jgi:predicted nuclease of restriction endonuclease-like RecB superfamily
MLTKEHLSFRIRNGSAKPQFLDASDAKNLAVAEDLLAVFDGAEGMRLGDLEDAADEVAQGDLGKALSKLLLDACDTEEDDGQVAALRWEKLLEAEALRRERPTSADFQQRMGATRDRLYGDLPACRRVRSYKVMDAEGLLHRYNAAQVQGLLLRARRVVVRLRSAELTERRELFRQLRFHRLLGEVRPLPATKTKAQGLEVELSGPLSLFDQAATYGLRLANFFPRVLLLSDWELEADVHIKNRELTLKLDASSGLKSHYKERRPYIPEELTALIDSFNERMAPEWRMTPGEDFVHLGQESYCFPDLTIRGNEKIFHVELFHRWHAAGLAGRLQALDKHPVSALYLGVSKAVARDPELASALKASRHFAKSGFYFSEFPTTKALAELLGRA